MILVTKKEFSDIANISKPAVSKLVRTGRIPVTSEGKIDVDSEACREYLMKKGVPFPGALKDAAPSTGGRASMFDDSDTEQPEPVKSSKTVSDVVSRRKLEMNKLAAQARNLDLKNAQIEGHLIAREVVRVGIFTPIETMFVRLLSEGATTIATKIWPLAKGGASEEEGVEEIRKRLTAFIRPVKDAMKNALSPPGV